MKDSKCLGWALLLAASLSAVAAAQPNQVNLSGATLFRDFFTKQASTNDFINVDGDMILADPNNASCTAPFNCIMLPFQATVCDCTLERLNTDDLAPSLLSNCTFPSSARWVVNARGTGSGNGLAEFVTFQLTGKIPTGKPSDYGYINRQSYYNPSTGECIGLPGCSGSAPNCTPTNWVQTSIDIGVMDVPTTWFVTAPGTPNWRRTPVTAGYGLNPNKSWCFYNLPPQDQKLKSLCVDPNTCLNLNVQNPDNDTVFDYPIAWVPVAYIANRGAIAVDPNCCNTGPCLTETQIHYFWLTGRGPTGENLIVGTRDSGSGTRNAAMNTSCIDPSWGRGDNHGPKRQNTKWNLLGRWFNVSNCGGSSEIEVGVQNARLAIGYSGLAGSSRAIGDARAGNYEILGVIFNERGGNTCVRPKIRNILFNCDPNSFYPIGGDETFALRGDVFESDPNNPAYVENQAAAEYMQNIIVSILATQSNPGGNENNFMPGELLAKDYFLQTALSCVVDPLQPCQLKPNPNLDPNLQAWTLANNGLGVGADTPEFGAYSNLYKVPTRAKTADYTCPEFSPPGLVWPDDPNAQNCDPNIPWVPQPQKDLCYPPRGYYSDGTDGSKYFDISGNPIVAPLSQPNWFAGDFNRDGCRDIRDIPAMMAAIYDRQGLDPLWDCQNPDSLKVNPKGQGFPWTTYKTLVPNAEATLCLDIIGDFNGDGNFDVRDVRYFCDGLALDPRGCCLQRRAAFKAVDDAWFALTGNDDNYFNTEIKDCTGHVRNWVRGATAADVFGNACGPAPGARPTGYDWIVDCKDAEYVDKNFGDWSNIDDAVRIDLSCDMSGDCKVDCCDAVFYHRLMGCLCPNLTNKCICYGDMNCDNEINFGDINPFVEWLSDPQKWADANPCCSILNGDANKDGEFNFADINPFVELIGTKCP